MKKTINSVLSWIVTAVFCVVATFAVGDQSGGTFSLMNHLDIFVLDAVLFVLIVYFFKPVWFYCTLACLLAASVLYATIGKGSGGSSLLLCALFVCMGAASVFVKDVHFFPLKKFNTFLGVWIAGFVLLDIILEKISGGSLTGMPVKFRAAAIICGVVFGGVGIIGKNVLSKAYGSSVNKYFLIAPPPPRLAPKAPVSGAAVAAKPVTGAGSVAVPQRKSGSVEKDDVKKSILDAKLAAMCNGPEDKAAIVTKNAAGGAQKAPSKPTTETGKIVSSVDFS